MDAVLVLFKENGDRKEFPLIEGKTIVGRKEECDLRIPLAEISRKHVMFMVDEKAVTLRDLGSSNGTYVNNQKVSERELAAGDHVVIGPVVFTLQIDGKPDDIKPVHTRLEAKSAVAESSGLGLHGPGESDTMESKDIFAEDDEDPISALEALAGSDDTSALDLGDSAFADSEEDSPE